MQDIFLEGCVLIVQSLGFRVGQGVFAQRREQLLIIVLSKQLIIDFFQTLVFLLKRIRLRAHYLRRCFCPHFIGPGGLR